MTNYRIPTSTFHTEIEVKRSRFIAYLAHTQGSEKSKAFIEELKQQYPDARHYCYAFMAGNPKDSSQYGYSDDGEPSGTAGKPMFTHLQHSDIGEICIVVVRYFGGTKLGTGGLARAYGDATRAAIEKAEFKNFIPTKKIKLSMEFALEAAVRKKIDAVGGNVEEANYSSSVTLQACIPEKAILDLPYSVVWLSKSAM